MKTTRATAKAEADSTRRTLGLVKDAMKVTVDRILKKREAGKR